MRRIRLIGILVAIFLSIPVLILEFRWEENHLQRIQSAGKLSVITFNGQTTYFEGNQGPSGFEYDLTSAFAEKLGVELDIIVADQFDMIVPAILALYCAAFFYQYSDDCPLGNFNQVKRAGLMVERSAVDSFRSGAMNMNSWILFLQ